MQCSSSHIEFLLFVFGGMRNFHTLILQWVACDKQTTRKGIRPALGWQEQVFPWTADHICQSSDAQYPFLAQTGSYVYLEIPEKSSDAFCKLNAKPQLGFIVSEQKRACVYVCVCVCVFKFYNYFVLHPLSLSGWCFAGVLEHKHIYLILWQCAYLRQLMDVKCLRGISFWCQWIMIVNGKSERFTLFFFISFSKISLTHDKIRIFFCKFYYKRNAIFNLKDMIAKCVREAIFFWWWCHFMSQFYNVQFSDFSFISFFDQMQVFPRVFIVLFNFILILY